MKWHQLASSWAMLILACVWPLLAACNRLQVGLEPTPTHDVATRPPTTEPQPTATYTPLPSTPTPTPGVFPEDLCQEYLELTVSADHASEPAVTTSYRCRQAHVDSTGRAPPDAPTLVVRQGTPLSLDWGTPQMPERIEVRLYSGAGISPSFMRWPDELPIGVEPVDRFQPDLGLSVQYTPQAEPGLYSLAVRATWQGDVDVFYALSFALEGTDPSSQVPDAAPPGLVYQFLDALWLVDAAGEPVQVSGNPGAFLAPHGDQLVSYNAADQEYWLIDRATGERQNLTRTPQRQECCFHWWPARSDVVLFSSIDPETIRRAPGSMGFLTAVDLNGSDYRVLDPEHDTGPGEIAPSPDGQTVAYGGGSVGWLYQWGVGPAGFDPLEYGLIGVESPQLGSPSWSPDGARLAWIIQGRFGDDVVRRMGVAVFDLAGRTVRVLHPYLSIQRGLWPPASVWDPEGRWLSFEAWARDESQDGVWVVQVDGNREEAYYLGQGNNPTWSPDGRWLAFNRSAGDVGLGIHRVETNSWEPRPLDLPPTAHLVGWVSLSTHATPPQPSAAAPQIAFLRAVPTAIEPGETVTLTWEATGERATLCPTARYVLFTDQDCREVALSGQTTFTVPLEARGFQFVAYLLRVQAKDAAAPAISQTSVALRCQTKWFFSDQQQAGICPRQAVHSYVAAQRFERGTMVWIEALGRYVVLQQAAADEGSASQRFFYLSDPLEVIRDTANQVEAPEGYYAPISGFGLVWRGDVSASPGFQQALGWALEPEHGYQAVWQCDDARPSGGRSWQTCYLQYPDDQVISLHPLGTWSLLDK